jgi:hypothetical protein
MFFFFLPLLTFIVPVFAQSSTLDESENSLQYILKIDNHEYPISYNVKGDVIAMSIDPESKSILIGLENTHDSQFSIELNHELLSAPNNEFVILVDGQDVDYSITPNSDGYLFTFFVPVDTEEVEIIGTSVIPEFAELSMVMMGLSFIGIVVIQQRCNLVRLLKKIKF